MDGSLPGHAAGPAHGDRQDLLGMAIEMIVLHVLIILPA